MATKTEKSYQVNKHRKENPDIAVRDMVIVSNGSQLTSFRNVRKLVSKDELIPIKCENKGDEKGTLSYRGTFYYKYNISLFSDKTPPS